MHFPNEATLKDRLEMMAKTFRFRLGAIVFLAVLFMTKETPHAQAFGVAICAWIAFEAFVKLYIKVSHK